MVQANLGGSRGMINGKIFELLDCQRCIPWWVDKRDIVVLFRSTFGFQKIRKTCARCRPLQIWRTLVRRVSTQDQNFAPEKCKSKFALLLCVYVFVWKAPANHLSRKPGFFLKIWTHGKCLKTTNISWFQNLILEHFFRHVLPMRYNSELLAIYVVISGNVLLFKDMKISFRL